MSDVRERLAKALKQHQFWHANHSSIGSNGHCLCGLRPRDQSEWADHVVADVLLSLPGIAIVELPEPDSTRYESEEFPPADRLAWFPDGEFSVSRWQYPEVQLEYRGEPLEPIAIRTARALAAALLAAANAADAVTP